MSQLMSDVVYDIIYTYKSDPFENEYVKVEGDYSCIKVGIKDDSGEIRWFWKPAYPFIHEKVNLPQGILFDFDVWCIDAHTVQASFKNHTLKLICFPNNHSNVINIEFEWS